MLFLCDLHADLRGSSLLPWKNFLSAAIFSAIHLGKPIALIFFLSEVWGSDRTALIKFNGQLFDN